MQMLKKLAVVAALSSIAAYASAMTPIADKDLSKVSGQDGVSIAADLHVNIGDFTYTNTSANGGSVSFKDIALSGTFAMTLDVISGASFANLATGTGDAFSVLGLSTSNAPAAIGAFYGGGDVVKIAIPNLTVDTAHQLNMSVGAISMGGSTASFGKMAMNNIQLQGTSVYIWAH
ncbi:MAG: DUF6160 family protein [Telluria sp.]